MIDYKNTKRAQLRRLVKQHPNWTYRQFAEALGQTRDAIRGAFGAMGLPRPVKERDKLIRRWDGTVIRKAVTWKQPENMWIVKPKSSRSLRAR